MGRTVKLIKTTCTGLAATSRPATPPPTTRPSGLANETLIPPDLLLVPPVSLGINEPDKDNISKRPWKNYREKIVKWILKIKKVQACARIR